MYWATNVNIIDFMSNSSTQLLPSNINWHFAIKLDFRAFDLGNDWCQKCKMEMTASSIVRGMKETRYLIDGYLISIHRPTLTSD